MNALLIINENSGQGRNIASELQHAASGLGLRYACSAKPGDVAQIAEHAAIDAVERLVIAGGDGTFNEALNGLRDRLDDIELAVVPCGTGNDLARSLGWQHLEDTNHREALQRVLAAPTRPLDIVNATLNTGESRLFANGCSAGVSSDVTEQLSDDAKQRWGPLAYWIAGATRLVDATNYDIEIEVNNQRQQISVLQIAVANARTVGGGFPVAPNACMDDGKLDLVIASTQSTVDLLGTLMSVGLGRHAHAENVFTLRTDSLRLRSEQPMCWSIDGEPAEGIEQITFTVHEAAARIATGDNAPACS